jgi:hypothetical protein
VRLTYRGINKQGKRTTQMVQRLERGRQRMEEIGPLQEGGDIRQLLESIDAKIQEGREYETFWQAAMHDAHTPSPPGAIAIKREWAQWGKGSRLMAQIIELPADQQREVIRKAILE